MARLSFSWPGRMEERGGSHTTAGSASRWPRGHHLAGPRSTHRSSLLLSWVRPRPRAVATAHCVCRGTTGGRIALSLAWLPSPLTAGGLRSDRGPTRHPGSTVAVSTVALARIPLIVVGSFTPARLARRQAIPPRTVRRLRERVRIRSHNGLWGLELSWTIYSYIFLVFLVHHLLPFVNESLRFSSNQFFNHYLLHLLAHPFTLNSSQPWALGLKSLPGGRA